MKSWRTDIRDLKIRVLASKYVCLFKFILIKPVYTLFKVKLHVKHPKEGGTKVCMNGPYHMTKMVAHAFE